MIHKNTQLKSDNYKSIYMSSLWFQCHFRTNVIGG